MASFKYIVLVAALLGAATASRLELNGFSQVRSRVCYQSRHRQRGSKIILLFDVRISRLPL